MPAPRNRSSWPGRGRRRRGGGGAGRARRGGGAAGGRAGAGGFWVPRGAARAVNAVRGLVEYAEARSRWKQSRGAESRPGGGREQIQSLVRACRSEGRRSLTRGESFGLLSRYGVRVARSRLSRTPAEAAQAAEEIGYPVALKIESPAIRHKTEAKALRLDVAGRQEVLRAFQEVEPERLRLR